MNKTELILQTRNAFEFIQKLYFEVSYLIKELEGQLANEDEKFVFGRTGGYAVTARSSNGLDPSQIDLWMYKKLAVFFAPTSTTRKEQGITHTLIKDNPVVLYLRIVLDDKDLSEPKIDIGVLKDFKKQEKGRLTKVEHVVGHIEYNESKVFDGSGNIDYKDNYIAFTGKLFSVNLYDIKNSQDIADKLIVPALKIFRGQT